MSLLNTTSVPSSITTLPANREGIDLKKFILDLPDWPSSLKTSPATVDISTDSGHVRLVIVEQAWSGDWPVPAGYLDDCTFYLGEGGLRAAHVVLVDHEWNVCGQAELSEVFKAIGFREPRNGVFWMKSSFRSAVKCFPNLKRADF